MRSNQLSYGPEVISLTRRDTAAGASERDQSVAYGYKKVKGRRIRAVPLIAFGFSQKRKLNRGPTAEEVEQNRNHRENQQDMDKTAGHMESGEAQQPQDQQNSGNNR
jgi:hypothetical protein